MKSARISSLCIALLASAALATAQTPPEASTQAPAAAPGKPAAPRSNPILALPPNTVVATIDGQKILAADLQTVIRALAPGQQDAALQNPRAFLEQFSLMRKLAELAEKAGLDQKSPLKEQLAYNRALAMAQAQMSARESEIKVSSEEVQKFYEANPDLFTTAKVKVIYIPFSPNAAQSSAADKKVLSEAEAKAKADKVFADLKGGADFVKMVRENSGDPTSASKDGDFGTLRRSDRLPEDIKTAVFSLKPGQVSGPVRQPNGFYIFRAEEIGAEPIEKVRDKINLELRNSQFKEWVEATQKSISIKIENEAAFAPAPPKPPAPPAAVK